MYNDFYNASIFHNIETQCRCRVNVIVQTNQLIEVQLFPFVCSVIKLYCTAASCCFVVSLGIAYSRPCSDLL